MRANELRNCVVSVLSGCRTTNQGHALMSALASSFRLPGSIISGSGEKQNATRLDQRRSDSSAELTDVAVRPEPGRSILHMRFLRHSPVWFDPRRENEVQPKPTFVW
jgi:hypothetical protein